jgi:hypothetical protein
VTEGSDPDSDTEMQEVRPSRPDSPSVHEVPIEAQHRCQQQQMVQTAITGAVRSVKAQQLSDEEFLAHEAREWNNRCWLCTQAGADGRQHGYRWWAQRMKGGGIRATDLVAVRRYLAQRVDTGHSRLAQDYIWIRRIYQERGF